MPPGLWALLLAAATATPSCAVRSPPAMLLVVAVDGLRHDYLDRIPAGNLARLRAGGAQARLVPIFPSKTLPNWYALATGLYAEQHGIVANTMYDAGLDAWFHMDDPGSVTDGRWWGGEPIWVTAERQGIRTAPLFWPGSEAVIRDVRPSYWLPFDDRMRDEDRVRQVLAWLDVTPDRRPQFVSVYFSGIDVAGHEFGPDSPELTTALRELDRLVGLLIDGLAARGILDDVNILVLGDHGQAARRPDQVIFLEDLLPPGIARVVDWSPVLQLRPEPGLEDSVLTALRGRHPHLTVYRKVDLPVHWHYRDNPRIQPIVALADEGWEIGTREQLRDDPSLSNRGSHGWDPALPSMHGSLVGWGPAFRSGVDGGALSNVHVYALLARLLRIEPAPNAGSPDSTAILLR